MKLALFIAGIYMSLKLSSLWERARVVATSFGVMLNRQPTYGRYVTASDPSLMESGNTCPICQVCPTWPKELLEMLLLAMMSPFTYII